MSSSFGSIGLALGGVQSFFTAYDTANQLDALTSQASYNASERKRQATEQMATQKTSYLKSGVTLSGSPTDVITETSDYAQADINAMYSGYFAQTTSIKNQAITQMWSDTLSSGQKWSSI